MHILKRRGVYVDPNFIGIQFHTVGLCNTEVKASMTLIIANAFVVI